MSSVTPQERQADSEEWTRRRKSNVQLGWAFAGLAVVLFVIALLKYRPL